MLAHPSPESYLPIALDRHGMTTARLISPEEMVFDPRTQLKCSWGCSGGAGFGVKCRHPRGSHGERVEMIRAYSKILLLHGRDSRAMSRAVVDIEGRAFLDGHHLAFGIRYCNLCPHCAVDRGEPCVQPQKIRPCEVAFGIDVYATARNLGLPCAPLKERKDSPNWYGFVCIC